MGGPAKCDGKAIPCTDNFFRVIFKVDGVQYCSSQNYFQCQKATNDRDFNTVMKAGPGVNSWEAGKHIKLKSDWEKIKVRTMYTANLEKFRQNPKLMEQLINTKGKIALTVSSQFWNHWNSLILTSVRARLRNEGQKDRATVDQIQKLIQEYEAKHRGKNDGLKPQCFTNLYQVPFEIDGVKYSSSQNYFQCQKATNEKDFKFVNMSGPGIGCWQAGQDIKIRSDWQKIKVRAMYIGNVAKFTQNPHFMEQLVNYQGKIKITGSSPFWNEWNGMILTSVRAMLRDRGQQDKQTVMQFQKLLNQYQAKYGK